MRCSSSPNENAWNACRDAVVTLVYGEDSFWIEAKDSPRRARIDVAALETAASTPALSGAVICSRPKTSPVAQAAEVEETCDGESKENDACGDENLPAGQKRPGQNYAT